jgi:flagellar protein FlaG
MSAETITTALFLITAVIAAGVLINAVYPVVYNMAGTFSSATHESDERMRTDFKVIASAASGTSTNIWMKNIGSERILEGSIENGDVFFGEAGNFDRIDAGGWTYEISDTNNNGVWEPGETLKITISGVSVTSGHEYYFQYSLPNGVWRSVTFTAG